MSGRDTRAQVAHLFRRAGFGLRPEELDHFVALGLAGSVDYLLEFGAGPDPAEQTYPPPDLAAVNKTIIGIFKGKLTPERIRAFGLALYQGKQALQEWWINRMLHTSRPLQEKMALFWHGHFATGVEKAFPYLMLVQNQTFRRLALGNFADLLKEVNQDPAMLLWLDGAENQKGKPNENFARELMELFTIGVGHYTERDVQEGARALTGWTLDPATFGAVFIPARHDEGMKTYLGHSGNFDADDVMNILAAHPHTGLFLARKLFSFFAYDNPDAATVQTLADTYNRSGYSIKAMLRQLLLSDAFQSDAAYSERISSPIEFVVGSARELGATIPVQYLAYGSVAVGQDLFNPPNVGGWPGGITWVDASALVARFNVAGWLTAHFGPQYDFFDPAALVQASGATDTAALVAYLLKRLVGTDIGAGTRAALLDYLGGAMPLSPGIYETKVRGLVQLILSSPEYQLN